MSFMAARQSSSWRTRKRYWLAEPKDIKKFGISQRTLYDIKRALATEGTTAPKGKTVKRLLAYLSMQIIQ
jgi:hypothetical protein